MDRAAQQALHKGTKYHLELELIRPNGSIRNIIAIGGPRYDNNNRVTGLYGVIYDITEYKQAELERQKSNIQYQALLESISDSIFVLDHEWKHVLVNDAGTLYTGYTKDILIGNKLTELFPGMETTEIFRTLLSNA